MNFRHLNEKVSKINQFSFFFFSIQLLEFSQYNPKIKKNMIQVDLKFFI
jgi:hypothetical protein